MIFLNSHFKSKNPFRKKFEDRKAIETLYSVRAYPEPKGFTLGKLV